MAEYLASQVIKVAISQIGTTETDNNNVKYNTWFYGHEVNGSKYPWCQVFVDWCFYTAYGQAGASQLLCGKSKEASTMSQKDAFSSAGRIVKKPEPGDIWWRKRSGGGHVGIVIKVNINGNIANITTIEGNTSPSSSGSQWNGDGVFQKEHVILLDAVTVDENGNQCWFGRPNYSGKGNLASLISSILPGSDGDISSGTIGRSGELHGGAGIYFGQDDSSVNKLLKASDYTKTLNYTVRNYTARFEDRTTEVVQDVIKTADINDLGNGGYTNLLSYPSLIEVPFIQLKVGNYTFGKYNSESINSTSVTDFPNYIKSLSVTKINGQLNKYTIVLNYQISTGDDPNLLDRIFSSVGFGKVYITYGDYNCPTFIYKEEEAILTKVTSTVNFNNSSIMYTVDCTSSALLLASNVFDFERRVAKPSDIIFEMLADEQYGLTKVFTGMTNKTQIINNNLICTDDSEVEIEAKPSTDPITYLQYLVTCMSASTNKKDNVLKDSTYRMTIHDDNFGDLNLKGCYFKITKIRSSAKALATEGVYEVDIGYPNDNQVMSFSVNTDNSWQLLYNYSDKISTPTYTYDIDNKGHLVSSYSPSYAKSTAMNKMTETQKTWWTNMTQFPISATLTLKGLVRPTILMTYIRVNALFYGQRHDTSGLYIITGQKDSISEQGYRTELALTRVAGDSDYIEKVKTQVTSKVLVGYDVSEREESVTIDGNKGLNDIKNYFSGIADFVGGVVDKISSGVSGFIDKVSDVFSFDDDSVANSGIYTTGDIAYQIWKMLRNIGCTEAGAAGLLGNIIHEGGLSPTTVEYSFCSELRKNNILTGSNEEIGAKICSMIDSGEISLGEDGQFYRRKAWGSSYNHTYWGIGLVQWTRPYDRKYGLYQLAKQMNKSIGSYEVQTAYIIRELQTNYTGVFNTLKTSNNVEECANKVFKDYEAPGDGSGPARIKSAKEMFSRYAQSNRTSTGR